MAEDTDRQFWVLLTVFGGLFGTGLFLFFEHPWIGGGEVIVGATGLASLIRDRIKHLPVGTPLRALASVASIIVIVYINAQLVSMRSDLDAYVMPRVITPKQAEDIRSALKAHPTEITIDVFASSGDPEALEYGGQLANVIRSGGWRVNFAGLNPWESGPSSNYGNGSFFNVYLAMDQGVTVRVGLVGQPTNEDPLHPTPGAVLNEALQRAQIANGSGGAADRGVYSVIVEVGRRPRDIRHGGVRVKLGQWIMQHLIFPPN